MKQLKRQNYKEIASIKSFIRPETHNLTLPHALLRTFLKPIAHYEATIYEILIKLNRRRGPKLVGDTI